MQKFWTFKTVHTSEQHIRNTDLILIIAIQKSNLLTIIFFDFDAFFSISYFKFSAMLYKIIDIWGGLVQTLDDSGKPMSHTDGTGEISEDVAKLLPVSVFKGKVNNKEVCFLHF
jgi:hypothetical protein